MERIEEKESVIDFYLFRSGESKRYMLKWAPPDPRVRGMHRFVPLTPPLLDRWSSVAGSKMRTGGAAADAINIAASSRHSLDFPWGGDFEYGSKTSAQEVRRIYTHCVPTKDANRVVDSLRVKNIPGRERPDLSTMDDNAVVQFFSERLESTLEA